MVYGWYRSELGKAHGLPPSYNTYHTEVWAAFGQPDNTDTFD